MNIKYGLILAGLICGGAMAQVPTNNLATPPAVPLPPPALTDVPVPPPSTNSAATGKKTKKHTKKAAADSAKKTAKTVKADTNSAPEIPFVINGTAISKQNNINIRAQSHINSEVVGHLQKGESVTVLEEVTLKHPKTDEPAKWVKIALPSTNHVWISTPLINASNAVVIAHKVNLRAGPGENFSVIGRVKAGDVIKPLGSKGEWTEIEPPTNAFAYVAAHLLTPQSGSPVPPVIAVIPTPSPVEPPTPIVAANPNPVVIPQPVPAVPVVPVVIPAPAPPVEEPPAKRIVEREGLVGGIVSINTPSHYQLRDLYTGRAMDYLYSGTTNISLKYYAGKTVLVSGEEELDERWPNTPVITIQRIQVVK